MRRVILLLLLIPFALYGQRWCLSDEYNVSKTFKTDRSEVTIEDVDLKSRYIIKVVFHILNNPANDNAHHVTNNDIKRAIDHLNRDFNLQNTDTSILTDTLKMLPGDMRIEFELADTTPDGMITNGITRTQTENMEFNYMGDNAKFDSTGGKTAWDTKKYFNIWVCNTSFGLLGYSQFPGGDERTDGVVINYDIFLEEPVMYADYDKGRVLAHEIGHSLSLRHPWGNGWGCGDNLVSDIPTQTGPSWDCRDSVFSNCDGVTTRNVVKHYMDYCGDSCMVMFTKGQVYNARESIQIYRMELVTIKKEPVEEPIKNIIIYPTINTGKLFVDFKNNFRGKEVILYLYDINGRLMQEEILTGGIRNDINLNIHTNGLYSVVLLVDGEMRFKDRIVYTKETYKRIDIDTDIDDIIKKRDER